MESERGASSHRPRGSFISKNNLDMRECDDDIFMQLKTRGLTTVCQHAY